MMLPRHLVVEFWLAVEQHLVKEHRLRKQDAQSGIAEYRRRTDLRVGEMVYHNNAEDVASTIAGILRRDGFEALDQFSEPDAGSTRSVS
jgi:hypothetical protein